jgi:glutaredoxin
MDLERLEPGHTVEMYVSPSCPYCKKARDHFDARSYPYAVHDAQNDRALRAKMFALTGGDPTVPAFVVDGAYVQSGWGSPPRG